mmetsp:Transcript_23694/g.70084  ORF Transcript_23694/g.70084 Transcript_23694/m.70084 type:complete len:217 (+) Transcript_23694:1353-2003(+)
MPAPELSSASSSVVVCCQRRRCCSTPPGPRTTPQRTRPACSSSASGCPCSCCRCRQRTCCSSPPAGQTTSPLRRGPFGEAASSAAFCPLRRNRSYPLAGRTKAPSLPETQTWMKWGTLMSWMKRHRGTSSLPSCCRRRTHLFLPRGWKTRGRRSSCFRCKKTLYSIPPGLTMTRRCRRHTRLMRASSAPALGCRCQRRCSIPPGPKKTPRTHEPPA